MRKQYQDFKENKNGLDGQGDSEEAIEVVFKGVDDNNFSGDGSSSNNNTISVNWSDLTKEHQDKFIESLAKYNSQPTESLN